jgi:hypothetical protein
LKLPAVWLAACFGAGIGLASRWPEAPGRIALVAVAALCVCAIALWRRANGLAGTAALVAWTGLGGLAANVERAIIPSDHVTRLIANGTIDLTEPLRWRGRLRETPMELPWGRRIEIDLDHV